jgi:hypothetical protein
MTADSVARRCRGDAKLKNHEALQSDKLHLQTSKDFFEKRCVARKPIQKVKKKLANKNFF